MKPIWMPLYVGDYLKDTRHLSTQEHGAYFLLLIDMWTKGGSLPDSDPDLARIAGLSLSDWSATRSRIDPFFDVANGVWTHSRITKELDRALKQHESRKLGAKKTNYKRWG